MREKFKLCGILNFLFVALNIFYNFFGLGILRILVLLVTGWYLYSLSEKTDIEIKKDKKLLILIGVFLMFANPISSVIILLEVDKLNLLAGDINDVKEIKKIDPEKRKMDILLKLGVAMVILAGFIFATTSWNLIPNIIKVLVLGLSGAFFAVLSYIVEEKYDLKKSSLVYYILAMASIWLSYYSIGYFGIMGDYLAIGGTGESLYYASNVLLISFLVYISYKKYEKEDLLSLTYFGLALAIIFTLDYFKLNIGINLLIVNTSLLIISNFLKLPNKKMAIIKKFAVTAEYILGIYTLLSFCQMNNIFIFANTLVFTIFMLLMIKAKENKKLEFANGILINIAIIFASCSINGSLSFKVVTLFAMIALLYGWLLYFKFFEKHKDFGRSFIIFANVIMLVAFAINVEFSYVPTRIDTNVLDVFTATSCAVIMLITSIAYLLLMQDKDKQKYEYYFIPIKIMPLIFCASFYGLGLTLSEPLILGAFIYGVISFYMKKSNIRNENIVIALVLLFLAVLINCGSKQLYSTILILLMTLYAYLKILKVKDPFLKQLTIPLLIFLLFVIHETFTNGFLGYTNVYLLAITVLAYIATMIFLRKDKMSFVITGYALSIPIFELTSLVVSDQDFSTMVTITVLLYMTYLTCKYIIKEEKRANLFAAIATTLFLLSIIFSSSILIGLYIGAICLLLILIGVIDDNYRSLFMIGIIFTIINILYQLRNLWTVIPFWLYLLLIGLGLIITVTYKEIKKTNK